MSGKRGRPRKDPELAISRGIIVQPKFSRAMHRQIKAAAMEEGLTITSWIRRLCCIALAERKQRTVAQP